MPRDILTGSISRLMVFYAPESSGGGGDYAKEPGNGVLEAGSFTVEGTSSEDETPPDYGALETRFGGEEDVPASKPAPAAGAPATEPPKVTTPAAEPPATKKPGKPGDEEPFPEIDPVRPGKPAAPPAAPAKADAPAAPPAAKTDHPTDPKRYADGTFKPGMEPPKPGEPAKSPEPKAGEPAPEVKPPDAKEETKTGPVPKDDADIEALQPKPTASEKTKNDFKALKEATKAARQYAREVEARLTEATAKASGELPEDVKTKLAEADEAIKFKQMFELENEPKARAEYSAKLGTTEEGIITMLTTHPQLKLPQAKADALKAAGFDSDAGIAMVNQWIATVHNGDPGRGVPPNPLLASQIAQQFQARSNIVSARAQEIEALRGNRDEYLRQRQEKEKGEYSEWGKTADSTLVALAQGHEWADYKKMPDNPTPEQRAYIEAHNKWVKETIVPDFNKAVEEVYRRTPDVTVNHVFNSMRLKYEVEPELQRLQTEAAAKDARIAELEALANGVRRVQGVSQAESAPAKPVTSAPDGISGAGEVSSDDSIDSFLREKGYR